MPRTFIRHLLVVALIGALDALPAPLLAQVETGTIAGTAVDSTGAPLPGVTITVTNLGTTQVRTVITNAAGRYQVPALPPGKYSVKAELQGFRRVDRTEVTVYVGSEAGIDFTMDVAGIETSLTVTDDAPIIERAKTDVSAIITNEQIENLPSKARQYLDLVLLRPATVENTSTTQQGSGLNLGGARAKETALLVDGFYNMDENFGLPRQRHSQESIQEFQVVSFGGSAEFGRAIGGIVNAVTKSGGNSFNGAVYGYFRNTDLNSQDPSQRILGVPKTEHDRQQWGGTLGGPLAHGKTFFFLAYDRVNEDFGYANSIRSADAARIGLPAADVGTLPRFYDLDFAMAKLDHDVNRNHHLQVSAAMSRWTEFDIATQTPLGSRSQQQRLHATDWSFMGKWTGIASEGRVLHDLKVSYFPRDYAVNGPAEGGPPLVADGQVNVGDQTNTSPPRVAITSVAIFGSAATNSKILTKPIQMLYSMSVFANRHRFKFGTDYQYSNVDLNSFQRLRGNYTFSSLDNYLAGRYATFSQSWGNPQFDRGHHYISAFGQDSWDVNDRLTMNYGLRYDLELHPKHPQTGQRLGEDYNNLLPRLGVSYDLSGNHKTYLKLASGLYVDRLYQRLSVWYPDLKGHAELVTATYTPTTPGAPVYPAVFATRPANIRGGVIDSWIFPDRLKTPMSGQVVTTLEHAVTPKLAVTGSFVYSRSWNKEFTWEANQTFDATRGVWVRPDPNYRVIRQYRFDGKAEYLGGILEVTTRGTRVGLQANLTLARSYDSGDTGDAFLNDQREGIDADWGPSIDTPKLRGVVNGWYNITSSLQIAAVFRARGGNAVTPVAAGLDLNGDARLSDRTPTFARGSFRLPSTNSLDARLTFAQSLRKVVKAHFYLEGFNLLNRDNVRTVITDYGPTPGSPRPRWLEPVTYFPPRELQLAVRLTF